MVFEEFNDNNLKSKIMKKVESFHFADPTQVYTL